MLNRKRMGRLAAIALIAPMVLGASAQSDPLVLQPQSKLWISGTSTLRSFECAAADFDVRVAATGQTPVTAVLRGDKAVTGATVGVPAANLDCNDGTMNSHMLKALKADQHPQIRFEMESYQLTPGANGLQARLNGSLTMGGTTRPVVIEAAASDAGAGVLRIAGSHAVKMSEYGLKRPSLMLGTLKVGDEVRVHFDLLLKA